MKKIPSMCWGFFWVSILGLVSVTFDPDGVVLLLFGFLVTDIRPRWGHKIMLWYQLFLEITFILIYFVWQSNLLCFMALAPPKDPIGVIYL
jgi:hypothetical protein